MMTGSEYQQAALRTCKIPYDRDPLAEVFPDCWERGAIIHAVSEINSEAGEIAGIIQKIYQGHNFDRDHMKKEIGDVLWGIAELCCALGFSVDDVMETNIEKLRARYPDGFDPDRSLHRQKGDV